jgi:UTP--glucose-1-phosphate uridylyltransferase
LARRIRRAVIPAAGLGTRFLPATKVIPKELLPIAGRPLIQYAVEEAAASGIETVILVTGREKNLLAEHFSRDLALETLLVQKGRSKDAEGIRRLAELVEIRTVFQDVPLGLGEAIRTAQSLVGDEPFAVILPDALVDSDPPCILQLMNCYQRHPGCIVATQTVDASEVDRFGILEVVPTPDPCCGGRTSRVTTLIERPQPGSVVSRNGIFGRYILEPEIFSCIEKTRPGFGGEIQLTDALLLCSSQVPLYAYRFEGQHYDAGSKLGFVQATIAYALNDPQTAQPLREYLCNLGLTQAVTAD